MQRIPEAKVDELWDRFMDMSEEQVEALFTSVCDAQPALVTYLMAMDETFLPESSRGDLLNIGICILFIMESTGSSIPQFTCEEVEEADEANTRTMQELDQGSEFDLQDCSRELFQTYNQWPLLAGALEAIMSESAEAPESAPEEVGPMFMTLKTVIDCVDRCP